LNAGACIKFGDKPVALMGGEGISSQVQFLEKRLQEERQVQIMNEKSLFWKLLQHIFWKFYDPWKIRREKNTTATIKKKK
jgi:hypothetical protein